MLSQSQKNTGQLMDKLFWRHKNKDRGMKTCSCLQIKIYGHDWHDFLQQIYEGANWKMAQIIHEKQKKSASCTTMST